MVAEYEADIGAGGPPPDWENAADWGAWRDRLLGILTTVLWPRYDYDAGAWVGAAAGPMRSLTMADFGLLQSLRPVLETTAGHLQEPVRHHVLFEIEDRGESSAEAAAGIDRSLDRTLRLYLSGKTDQATIDTLANGYLAGLGRKSGSVDLQLKQHLQRPRAYQMAGLLGQRWFTHQHATSAVTPAMISGHCFQGGMGGVAVFYRAQSLGCPPVVLTALGRHAVDVGDRRVFAGVHYPSDNISSWITALLICPLVCQNDRSGRTFLWQAISGQSAVYAAIRDVVQRGPANALRTGFALLEALGGDASMDIDGAERWVRDNAANAGGAA
jgi:hypothetical protein